jgi:hypothetical protein
MSRAATTQECPPPFISRGPLEDGVTRHFCQPLTECPVLHVGILCAATSNNGRTQTSACRATSRPKVTALHSSPLHACACSSVNAKCMWQDPDPKSLQGTDSEQSSVLAAEGWAELLAEISFICQSFSILGFYLIWLFYKCVYQAWLQNCRLWNTENGTIAMRSRRLPIQSVCRIF